MQCIFSFQAGCVHFPPQSASETRIILLLFSLKQRAFVGLIPNDQSAFVQGIKNVLTQHKQRVSTNRVLINKYI
jgi:mediator of RNA polymerase II transcription subunit 25